MKTQSLILIFLILAGRLSAQSTPYADSDSTTTMPPLATVVKYALLHHPVVQRDRASVRKSEAELNSIEKKWLDGLSLDAGFQWGSYGDQTVNTLLLGSRVGVTVRLSLWDILSQGDANEQYEAVVEAAKHTVTIAEKEITREVVVAYNEAILSGKLFSLSVGESVTARINKQTARQQFTEGEIAMSEYARISMIDADAALKVETYRSRWKTAIQLLEILAGRSLEDMS